jgi:NAD(P)H dehydrogenase (quinone)
MVKTVIIFYSSYGHMFEMAKAAVEGAQKVKGAEVSIRVSQTDYLILLESQRNSSFGSFSCNGS